jgi:hypothetical protein
MDSRSLLSQRLIYIASAYMMTIGELVNIEYIVFTVSYKKWLGLLNTLRTPSYYNYLVDDNTIFQDFGMVG